MPPQTSQRVSGDFTWTPTPEQLKAANVARLARKLGCASYAELHRVSIEEDRFWRAVVDDLGLPLSRDWDEVDTSRGIEWATWFLGARLNLAEACVHRWAREQPDREAACGRRGERRALTWAELSREVRRLAAALRQLGVGEGDTVGTFLPMAPEGDRLARVRAPRRNSGSDLLPAGRAARPTPAPVVVTADSWATARPARADEGGARRRPRRRIERGACRRLAPRRR